MGEVADAKMWGSGPEERGESSGDAGQLGEGGDAAGAG